MTGVGKTAIAALCLNLAVTSPAFAADASAQISQNDTDRLEKLLSTIEDQNQKLERQQADIDRQRAELEKQRAELMRLKASLTGAASAPALAQASRPPAPLDREAARSEQTAHAQIVRTRYGYLPVPREAPRDGATQLAAGAAASPPERVTDASVPAPSSAIASAASPRTAYGTGSQLVGSSAKNDLGIPAPQSDTEAVADNADAYNDDGTIRRHTLKDLVRRAIAPTLSGQSEVGEKPKKETPNIDIAVLADRGGVLTPRGTLVFTPTVEYSHSSVDRFFFDGVEIAEAVLIGDFLAQNIDRDSITSTFGARYGVTSRLEVDAQIPFLYRDDKTFNKALVPGTPDQLIALDGKGLGDIEFGAHYQLNKPKGPYPYFVAGIRAKSPTGKGPFDVPYDLSKGLPSELPTGSGFWTVEPQFTMIYPSDPVVLFANIGYQYTFGQDVNKVIQDTFAPGLPPSGITGYNLKETRTTIGQVSPGGAVDIGLGMGIGLNDSVSMSFGYQHSWILGTDTHSKTQVFFVDASGQLTPLLDSADSFKTLNHSQDAQIGQLLIGTSIAVDDNVGLNFNVAIGVTDEAPDVTVTFRTPLTWRLSH